MLLAMDVGNSNIKMGIFSGDDLVQSFRVRTDHKRSSDEYGVMMHSFLSCIGMEFSDFHGVMISSVVPGLNFTLMRMVQTYFHKTPAFVSSQLNCGIDISYSPVSAQMCIRDSGDKGQMVFLFSQIIGLGPVL